MTYWHLSVVSTQPCARTYYDHFGFVKIGGGTISVKQIKRMFDSVTALRAKYKIDAYEAEIDKVTAVSGEDQK